ncbi:hypothetical protein [Sphingomonas sp. Leaf38]|uniref:hypothetical protein n=1 Tax=Sphingomonas sp. Leaf38 TaxID=1736217 RepID=UPI0012E21B48|nr:hypothetical protein [Sphingomonas sp. Leaf38]
MKTPPHLPKRADHSFPSAEVFTKEVPYVSGVTSLTSLQWKIVRSTSNSALALGGAVGAIFSYAVPIGGSWLRGVPASVSDLANLKIAVAVSIIIVLIGIAADKQRRKLFKTFDKRLLSDAHLGIEDDS